MTSPARPQLVLLMAAVLCSGCRSHAPAATETVTIWQERGRWSGHAPLQTDPFIGTSGLLRVTWDARSLPASRDASLRIVLHSDVSGRALASIVEQHGPGGGTKYVTEDPRSFFLVIESRDLEWEVQVAEGFTGGAGR